MLQSVEEAQRVDRTADSSETLAEILAHAGVSIPTRRDMAPFRAGPRRPRWLAFVLRVLRIG